MILFEEMIVFNDVKFDCCMILFGVNGDFFLVVFCDVLWLVFGVCVYVRWKFVDGRFGIRFVVVKIRVVFFKELIILWFEL